MACEYLACLSKPAKLALLAVLRLPHRTQIQLFTQGCSIAFVPKARRAGRHIATANAERRGARPKLENEDFARAKPVEAGKPGLSGRCRALAWKLAWVCCTELRLYHGTPAMEDL